MIMANRALRSPTPAIHPKDLAKWLLVSLMKRTLLSGPAPLTLPQPSGNDISLVSQSSEIRRLRLTHDKGIVEADNDHEIDTLLLKLAPILHVWRDVVGVAAWGECTRHRDEDDLLVLELFTGIVRLRNAAD